MSIKTLIELELEEQYSAMSAETDKGSDKYKTMLDCNVKLLDRAIEINKQESERQAKERERKFENDLKLKQLKSEQRDRNTKNIIAGVSILVTVVGTVVCLKFEETGSITTLIGRAYANAIGPKKMK